MAGEESLGLVVGKLRELIRDHVSRGDELVASANYAAAKAHFVAAVKLTEAVEEIIKEGGER